MSRCSRGLDREAICGTVGGTTQITGPIGSVIGPRSSSTAACRPVAASPRRPRSAPTPSCSAHPRRRVRRPGKRWHWGPNAGHHERPTAGPAPPDLDRTIGGGCPDRGVIFRTTMLRASVGSRPRRLGREHEALLRRARTRCRHWSEASSWRHRPAPPRRDDRSRRPVLSACRGATSTLLSGGSYTPLVGNFDGDQTTDVLWYTPDKSRTRCQGCSGPAPARSTSACPSDRGAPRADRRQLRRRLA